MRVRNVILIILLASLAVCKRETFEPVAEPMSLRLMNPGQTIDLVAEPLKEQMISWDGKKLQELQIEGVLNIEYRGEYYQYLQLKCAAELQCNGSNAYAPISLAMQLSPDGRIATPYSKEERKKRPFLIVPSTNSQQIDSLLAWMKNPTNEVPEIFDENLLKATAEFYIDSLAAPEQESRIAGWYYLGLAMKPEEHDSNFEPFLKRFKDYDKILNVDERTEAIADAEKKGQPLPGELSHSQVSFLKVFREFIGERFMESLDSYYYDFPFLARDNAGLAAAMNGQKLPLYNERVIKDLLEEANYKGSSRVVLKTANVSEDDRAPGNVEENDNAASTEDTNPDDDSMEKSEKPKELAVTDHQFSNAKGLSIQVGTDPAIHLTSIQAKPHKLGLAFQVQGVHQETGSKFQYELEPHRESTYLVAARKSTLDKFRKIKDEEIMKAATFQNRLLLATLKYGEGNYDRRSRKFQYVVYMDKPSYWRFLSIIKSNKMIDVRDDSTYSGPLDLPNSESKLRWAQHYDKGSELSQLKLHGQFQLCERDCWDETIEVACLDNTRQSYLIAEFPARALTNVEQGDAPVEFILVHENLQQGYYHLEQVCSEALGVTVQREFTDWIVALGRTDVDDLASR